MLSDDVDELTTAFRSSTICPTAATGLRPASDPADPMRRPSPEGVRRLVQAMARQAAAEHRRKAYGFSVPDHAPVIMLVAVAMWLLMRCLGAS